jgi:hypothetical protein
MRIVPNKIVCFLLALMCWDFAFAAPNPPTPQQVPPPPGLSLDNGLMVLFVLSILLGLHKIYSIKKASR